MPHRILVVDDEQIIRDSISFVLKKEGYTIEEAPNGKVAFDKISEEPFDVVITDIEMPVMNGLELIKAVKDSGEYRGLPIIVVSSYMDYRERLVALGVRTMVDKSTFSVSAFMQAITKEGVV